MIDDVESTDSEEPSESETVPVNLTYSCLDMDSTDDIVSKHEVQTLEKKSVQANNNTTLYVIPQLASEQSTIHELQSIMLKKNDLQSF